MDKETQYLIKESDDLIGGEFKIIPPKDVDSFQRMQYLKILLRVTYGFLLSGIILLGKGVISIIGFIIWLSMSIVAAFVVHFLINQVGNNYVSLLYGGSKANWSMRETLHGDLLRVKYMRRNKNFVEALNIVNTILEHDPDHKEALFIKAEILWEAFGNYGGAKMCLKKIIDMNSSEDEHINQWATNLCDKITLEKKCS